MKVSSIIPSVFVWQALSQIIIKLISKVTNYYRWIPSNNVVDGSVII